MASVLVLNRDRIAQGQDINRLRELGYEVLWVEGEDTPAVQAVPSKEDRRFTAAVAAARELISQNEHSTSETARLAVRVADALLAELSK